MLREVLINEPAIINPTASYPALTQTMEMIDDSFKSIIEKIKRVEWVVTCGDKPGDKRPQSIIEQLIDNYFLPLRRTKNSVINSESL